MKRVLSLFLVDTSNLELLRAQLKAFSKQVPLLYFILSVNTVTLASTHYGKAPFVLTVLFPAALIGFCLIRGINWLRVRHRRISDKEVIRRLYGVVILGGLLGAFYLGWALSIYDYGNAYTKSNVAFFTAVTVISSIFCLLHLRAAALALITVIAIPFSAFLLFTQGTTFVAIGINLLLVSAAMVYILVVVSTDFEKMINSQIETARLSEENHRLANIDSLTELPNRRHFFQQLNGFLACAKEENTSLVVGIIDLDGFKAVNDIYGHVIGDRVLTKAGQRLEALSSDTTLIARLGGDEFGVLIIGAQEHNEILAFGERVCAALQRPFSLPEAVANVSCSVGFATFPEAGNSPELLYERADYALNYAKEHQRGRPTIFSKSHETEIRTRSTIEQALRCADLESELSLCFQPLFDVAHQRPIAFEALARWHNPELGNIPPNVFIAIAERTELINTLTQVLLRKALDAASTWPEEIHVSFNLSVRDILSVDSMTRIIAIVQSSGVEPGRIGFEVTESALMGDFEQAHDAIARLRALGTRVSLDDFGTGYSSLSYVHRLPLDTIKIDRSFVLDIETRATSRNIIRTIVDLCRNLEIGCVVEGMETEAQADILRDLGCNTMQGYFFSKPLAEKDVLDFLSLSEVSA
ncbi:EAL domain-containing protein [Pistricoccus aurantiacus]|uniref:EAL domain-containing protein n=1 Tax=Pistricoccus aurantiacus TaxID=1883414 RepID=A0A5B8SRY5_9GAMM|nr:EAL domain-containing protein [Pistricoccus aurantiacus]QEA38215.1 EAL domain-containing protein [Pistricoccus aurantiacus]